MPYISPPLHPITSGYLHSNPPGNFCMNLSFLATTSKSLSPLPLYTPDKRLLPAQRLPDICLLLNFDNITIKYRIFLY